MVNISASQKKNVYFFIWKLAVLGVTRCVKGCITFRQFVVFLLCWLNLILLLACLLRTFFCLCVACRLFFLCLGGSLCFANLLSLVSLCRFMLSNILCSACLRCAMSSFCLLYWICLCLLCLLCLRCLQCLLSFARNLAVRTFALGTCFLLQVMFYRWLCRSTGHDFLLTLLGLTQLWRQPAEGAVLWFALILLASCLGTFVLSGILSLSLCVLIFFFSFQLQLRCAGHNLGGKNKLLVFSKNMWAILKINWKKCSCKFSSRNRNGMVTWRFLDLGTPFVLISQVWGHPNIFLLRTRNPDWIFQSLSTGQRFQWLGLIRISSCRVQPGEI